MPEAPTFDAHFNVFGKQIFHGEGWEKAEGSFLNPTLPNDFHMTIHRSDSAFIPHPESSLLLIEETRRVIKENPERMYAVLDGALSYIAQCHTEVYGKDPADVSIFTAQATFLTNFMFTPVE